MGTGKEMKVDVKDQKMISHKGIQDIISRDLE
jgi:hypothetical protein